MNIIGEGLFYDNFALVRTRKQEKRNLEELACQLVNSCPCMCYFTMKLKIIGKFCSIIFMQTAIPGYFVVSFHCLVCHSY